MYVKNDVMRLAGRYNNSKRSYLIVNPLQAKHMPVPPSEAFEMMCALGGILKHTGSKLIIGFAETATAIGAVSALSFPDDTYYMHTTREFYNSETVLNFCEEHSHAVQQQLFYRPLSTLRPDRVIMIDDEISTGKTIENIVDAMRKELPNFRDCEFTVGSVINRTDSRREAELLNKNIKFLSLVKINNDEDLEQAVRNINVKSPVLPDNLREYSGRVIFAKSRIPDMRKGLYVGDMKREINAFTNECVNYIKHDFEKLEKILVLGTEECMLPAIMLGMEIEKFCGSVYTHSTTRSPIGIKNDENYPCRNGFQVRSFYESERLNYLYNTDRYDAVVVVTDSKNDIQCERAFRDIMSVFSDCGGFYLIRG